VLLPDQRSGLGGRVRGVSAVLRTGPRGRPAGRRRGLEVTRTHDIAP